MNILSVLYFVPDPKLLMIYNGIEFETIQKSLTYGFYFKDYLNTSLQGPITAT